MHRDPKTEDVIIATFAGIFWGGVVGTSLGRGLGALGVILIGRWIGNDDLSGWHGHDLGWRYGAWFGFFLFAPIGLVAALKTAWQRKPLPESGGGEVAPASEMSGASRRRIVISAGLGAALGAAAGGFVGLDVWSAIKEDVGYLVWALLCTVIAAPTGAARGSRIAGFARRSGVVNVSASVGAIIGFVIGETIGFCGPYTGDFSEILREFRTVGIAAIAAGCGAGLGAMLATRNARV